MGSKTHPLFEDSLAGSALGLFSGDALGAPMQGLFLIPLRRHLGWVNEMLNGRTPPGTYTDDTQVMIGLLEALEEDDSLPEGLLAGILAHNHDSRRHYGASVDEALERLRLHEIDTAALSRDSFSNGGAKGIAPLGVYFSADLAGVTERAQAACCTTHRHPEATSAAAAVAGAAALMAQARFKGDAVDYRMMMERLLALPGVKDSPMERALHRLDDLPVPAPSHVRSAHLAGIFDCNLRAVESVPVAIAAAFTSQSLREAIEVGVNAGGDTDSQGAMAGGIAGAYYGEAAVPVEWSGVLENGFKGRDYVRALVRRLAARRAR